MPFYNHYNRYNHVPRTRNINENETTKNEDSVLSLAAAADKSYTPNMEDLDKVLRGDNIELIIAWVKRYDIQYTKEQYDRGVKHPDRRVRVAWFWWHVHANPKWAGRVNPNDPQVVKDGERAIALLFSSRGKRVTPEEFEKYITHPVPKVRKYWALYGGLKNYGHMGINVTQEQIKRGLNDWDMYVRAAWEYRSVIEKYNNG
jgi:hypothetical protein